MPSETVLIVDDMSDARKLLSLILRSKGGFLVLEARNGHEALSLAERGPVAVVVDYMMPDMNGAEVCRHLRSNPATRHLPILMLTARSDARTRDEAIAAGADSFMAKPLHPNDLVQEVRRLIDASPR